MQRILSYTLLYFFLYNFGYSQNYSYQQFTTEDGLPTNYVYGVLEDRNGYIWAYTENGVAKFDGHTFKTYTVEDGLTNNDIIYMEEDSSGVIWLHGIHNDIQYIKNDTIYTFQGLDDGDIVRVKNYFCNTEINHAEYYVINGPNPGRKIRLLDGEIIETLYAKTSSLTDIQNIWSTTYVSPITANRHFCISNDGSRYCEFLNDSLVCLDLKSPLSKGTRDLFYFVPIDDEKIFNIHVNKKFITFLNIISKETKRYELQNLLGGIPDEYSFQKLENSIILQSSLGYIEFNLDWEIIDLIAFEKSITNYSAKRSVKDSNGNLWIGTREGGLLLITKNCLNNILIPSPLREDKSFDMLYKDYNDYIYVLSDNAQLYKIQNENLIHIKKLELGDVHIRNIENGPENNLLVSSSRKTLLLKDEKTLNFIDHPYFKGINDLFSTKSISSHFSRFDDMMYVPKSNEFYCSYPEQAAKVFYRNKENKYQYKSLDLIGKYFFRDTINDILYISAPTRLYKLDEDLIPSLELELKAITTFFLIDKDFYLIGTESSGLFLYSLKEKKLTQYTKAPFIRKIIKDSEHYYIACNEGVLVGQIKNDEWKPIYTFNSKDGLPSEEIRDILVQDDHIYATSFKGVIKLNKQIIHDAKLNPIINNDLTLSEVFNLSENSTVINENPNFKYNLNNISFSYHLKNFDSRGNINYEYKLDPIQSEWQKTSERNQSFYNLQPNNYSFKLRATDAFGRKYILEDPYNFIIHNPFWKTWWFRFIGILTLMLVAFSAYKIKTRRIAREVQAEKELNNKIAKFKIEALSSQMNPHFVFNALSSIQYYVQNNDSEKADKFLTMFGRLIRKYLNFSQVQMITLEQEIELLSDYIRLEQMRFENVFSHELVVDPSLDLDDTYIPPMLVQPYIENAIIHGLHKRNDKKGILKINFRKTVPEGLCICICDNGIGIKKSKAIKSSFHKSHGMNNIMDRIAFLKLSQELRIDLKVETLNNDPLFPGTKVILEIHENT